MSEKKLSGEELALKQDYLLSQVKKSLVNFGKDGPHRKTASYFKVKLENLALFRTQFEDNHTQILISDLAADDAYFGDDTADKFEEAYIEAVSFIMERRDEKFAPPAPAPAAVQAQPPAANAAVPEHRNVRLPKINVPKFSGKYTDWPAFYDSFERLVHSNGDVKPPEKFHHLKEALPEDSDTDIRNLPNTDTNYAFAWPAIIERYDNKRVLFKNFMDLLSLQPAIKTESHTELKKLVDTSRACVNALKEDIKIPIDQCDHLIVYFLIAKLPRETHQLWEQALGNTKEVPTFTKFIDFLSVRYRTLEAINDKPQVFVAPQQPSYSHSNSYSKAPSYSHSNNKQPPAHFRSTQKTHHVSTTNGQHGNPYPKCGLCSAPHILRRCPAFLSMNSIERKSKVEQLRHCLNCLSPTHFLASCPSAKCCQVCGDRHNTLIHLYPPQSANTSNSNAPTTASVNHANHTHVAAPILPTLSHATKFVSQAEVLLPTAVVKATSSNGQTFSLRMLIDQGSTGALISQRACQSLQLQYLPVNSRIDLPDGQSTTGKSAVQLTICSRYRTTPKCDVFATVVNSVTSKLPARTLAYHDWPHIIGLELADPEFFRSAPIDLLVGSDLLGDILMEGLRKGNPNEPIAQQTIFGWIISGRAFNNAQSTKQFDNSNNNNSDRINNNIQCSHISFEQLDSLVKEFFALESIPTDQQYTPEEKWCAEYIRSTTVRKPDGKYMVRLPLKTLFNPELTIGRSRQLALSRFHSLERRLAANPSVSKQYHETIQEYFQLGQIEPVNTTEEQHITQTPKQQLKVTCFSLPHHAVLKEDSLTTKCRVVYNASSRTSNGQSLNDILCTGPRLQNDLPAVLLNWRLHRFVITADIGKMYRCIDLHPEDTDYHRMWWRDEHQQLREYKLNTVTFGTASAPYTAIAILHRIADDESERFPLACNVLKKETFVDDMYTGSHTIENTRTIRDQTQSALLSAGMKLHKWASNTSNLLDTIPKEHQSSATALDLNSDEILKTLGMRWQPNTDQFCFKVNFSLEVDDAKLTKRIVLSTAAKLFDPLGLISPIVVVAKIFLKKLWSMNLDWDDILPPNACTEWRDIVSSFAAINNIRVPRWLHYTPSIKSVELHAFSDGSKNAYASIVYMRIEDTNEQVHTHIITAKSKVTPTTSLSIPRIELCGAAISIKLIEWARTHLALDPSHIDIHYWTDATIVLAWIRGDINRWPLFVANRIGQIHTHSNVGQWHHVPTHDNPADISSRGATAEELIESNLYWHGPLWLCEPKEQWPVSDWPTIEHQINAIIDTKECSIIDRYSSFIKLQHLVGWILRFKNNCRTPKALRHHGPLTAAEIQVSLFTLVRLTQQECFATEHHALSRNEHVSHKSQLLSLTPFIDAHNIIRVRGRLEKASMPYGQKHPMILPKNHPLTNLLIDYAHTFTLHGGCQLTAAFLRKRFWIIHHRKIIASKIKACMNCYRQKAPLCQQLMGDLPAARVNSNIRAFAAVGIDYAGPIELKSSRFRGTTTYKGYIAVFVCLAVKAIHLEAVTGLSTDHFMSALYRFMARRGMPHDIYSDNGTNFIGAEKCLKTNAKQFNKAVEDKVIPALADIGIQWHFIPPSSPNFGGLWEANVKSVKHHLYRTFNGTPLTFEDLTTALARIESVLNSRPLCPLQCDSDDLLVLTPGHFLIGDSLLAPPEPADIDLSLASRFSTIQRLAKQFWSRWKSDWLGHLQSRSKWATAEPDLKVNDLVLIKDDRLPSNQWARGRIAVVHPGTDQHVRVVTVRTAEGTYRRCVSKISKLPIQDNYTMAESTTKTTGLNPGFPGNL